MCGGLISNFFLGFWAQELVTVARMDGDVTNFGSLKNPERNINACSPKRPHFTVKIRKPSHRPFINSENKIAGYEACLFSRTSRRNPSDEDTAVCLFYVNA
jgi:hypothetical protein